MSDTDNESQEIVNSDLNSNDSKTLVIGSGVRMEGKLMALWLRYCRNL